MSGPEAPPGSVTVAVIAKEPVAGRVKTRLVPPLTPGEAAEVASASLSDTIAAVDAAASGGLFGTRLLYLEGEAEELVGEDWEVVGQCSGGLGERLEWLFARCSGPCIVVGMDTPQLTVGALEAALDSLILPGVDAVLGPATDGGYWTIGFDRHVPGAFEGVPMSEATTGQHQLERLRGLGLSVELLEEFRDIDHWQDAVAIAAEHPHLRTSKVVAAVADRLGAGPQQTQAGT